MIPVVCSRAENSRVLKSYDDSVNELYAFFSDHKDSLDTYATMQMLRSYGRLNELVHYAKLIGDWESVVQHHIEVTAPDSGVLSHLLLLVR